MLVEKDGDGPKKEIDKETQDCPPLILFCVRVGETDFQAYKSSNKKATGVTCVSCHLGGNIKIILLDFFNSNPTHPGLGVKCSWT